MIKVLQERRVSKENYGKLLEHLIDLRAAALHQQGYLTGETLVKGDNPIEVLTISSWISEDHWKAWTTSEERIELNDVIDRLIEGEARTSVYSAPFADD
jgi:heme-degrading monooxygenase HmoA